LISAAERSVHLVDPNETTRKSISFLLRELGYVVHAYSSLDELLNVSERLVSGCVLLDLPPPGANDRSAPDWLRSLKIPVIVLSGSGDIATAVEALKSGATDFIEKPFRKLVLLDALAAAVIKPQIVSLNDGSEEARDSLEALTPRERDVLHGLARGCSNKVIGHELGISPRTVEIHRARMMNRLGIRSLSHALRLAFGVGLESEIWRRAPAAEEPVRATT